MQTILKKVNNVMVIEKSRFITLLYPVHTRNEVLEILEEVKQEYANATHYCYAYIIDGDVRASDDGEPSGTAGKPMLDVLLGEEVHDTVVVVTRYFGGTLLGTGGLVRAYGGSLNEVIKIAEFLEYKKLENHILECEYSSLGQLEYILNQNSIKIINKDFLNIIKITIQITKDEFEALKSLLPREIKIL